MLRRFLLPVLAVAALATATFSTLANVSPMQFEQGWYAAQTKQASK
jgi:hypothetical protein